MDPVNFRASATPGSNFEDLYQNNFDSIYKLYRF